MSSTSSSSETVPERSANPCNDGFHPQFPTLLAKIDGRLVVSFPLKNLFREPKNIPYIIPIYESGTPSWSCCEYFSTLSILSIKEEVVYPWEIDVALSRITNVQEQKLTRTKQTVRPKILPELMAEGFLAGNSQSSSESMQWSFKVCSTSTSSSEREGKVRSPGSRCSASMAKRRRP